MDLITYLIIPGTKCAFATTYLLIQSKGKGEIEVRDAQCTAQIKVSNYPFHDSYAERDQ